MTVSRRRVLQGSLGAVPGYFASRMFAAVSPARKLAPGPFQPTWDSLRSQYKTPEWFRDAKFGIWAHWSAQCVPEQGDWYARQMYLQGHPQYEFHCKTYGHPSKFGFMQIDHLWKAERWQPEELMGLYKKAGAKYFMALANHHDNLDTYASSHHAWNTLNVGPKKDLIGTWAKTAREHGLRFGVSNHSAHSWHWFQTAYGYDPEGPMAGVRYDAYTTKKADSKGQWWQGLDPQKLYNGPIYAMPDGIKTIKEANDWHAAHDRKWDEEPPAGHQEFVDTWFLRCQELLDKYEPDMIYFDNSGLPLGQAGLDVTAHYYNTSAHKHGQQQCVVFAKELPPEHLGAVTLDIERGKARGILADPWQTDTCIGDWHYNRKHFTNHSYKSAKTVISMLVDIVSKNGNLLLSVPVRGDGSLDEDEHTFLGEMADWMSVHGEAIYETRPWKVYGEGPEDANLDGHGFNESKARVLGAEDIRFTAKGQTLYATVLGWPENGKLTMKTVTPSEKKVAKVAMLGGPREVKFTQDAGGLTLQLPEQKKEQAAYSFRIEG